jgi:hypothetical protein
MLSKASFMLTESSLGAAIESENAALSELRLRIDEEPLRLLLQSASNTLSFVSMAFLAPNVMERARTADELASWLSQAERHVERAQQIRREVEAAMKLRPHGAGGTHIS